MLTAQIKRTTLRLLARHDNELDLLIAATEALEESEMLGQPDPTGIDYDPDDPEPYVTNTPAAQAALRNRADELVQRANEVRIAGLRATRPRPSAGSQRIRGSLYRPRPLRSVDDGRVFPQRGEEGLNRGAVAVHAEAIGVRPAERSRYVVLPDEERRVAKRSAGRTRHDDPGVATENDDALPPWTLRLEKADRLGEQPSRRQGSNGCEQKHPPRRRVRDRKVDRPGRPRPQRTAPLGLVRRPVEAHAERAARS